MCIYVLQGPSQVWRGFGRGHRDRNHESPRGEGTVGAVVEILQTLAAPSVHVLLHKLLVDLQVGSCTETRFRDTVEILFFLNEKRGGFVYTFDMTLGIRRNKNTNKMNTHGICECPIFSDILYISVQRRD